MMDSRISPSSPSQAPAEPAASQPQTQPPVSAANRLDAPLELCDACFTGTVMAGEPQGVMLELGGTQYYYAAGSGEGAASGKAIVIATDIFGLGVPNPKLNADRIAEATSFPVFVPDLLQGDPAPIDRLKATLIEKPFGHLPLLKRLSIWARAVVGMLVYVGPSWVYRHRMGVVVPLATKFCEDLKKEKDVRRLGMVGYCLGGQVTTLLSSTTLLDVIVTAHPGFVAASEFAKTRQPLALLCSQEDFSFDRIKPDVLKILDTIRKEQNVPIAVYEYPGTTHGFAARPDTKDEVVKAQYEKALDETSAWFKEHL